MSQLNHIGVAGLGAIGLGMAQSLIRSGFQVTGYDINPEAAGKLQRDGGRIASTVHELSQAANCIICVVATSEQATDLFFNPTTGALPHLQKSAIIVLGITARPDFVKTFQEKIKEAGRPDLSVIDCPVSGGEARAQAGTLSLLCSGDSDCLVRLGPVFESLGSEIHTIPGGLGVASQVKFVHQIFVGVNIAAAVEVFALSQIAGLDLKRMRDYVMESEGASWLFGQRVSHMIDPATVPASSLAIIAKDMSMISSFGRAHGTPLLMSLMAEQLFKLASISSQDTKDDTNMASLLKSSGGKSFQKSGTASLEIGPDDIASLLSGIHTAASVEVISLARLLDIDISLLVEVVKTAAGANDAFQAMAHSLMTSNACEKSALAELEARAAKLRSVIDKVSGPAVALPMASVASQVLSLAASTSSSTSYANYWKGSVD